MPKFSFLPIGFPDAHSGAKLRVFTVVSVSRNNFSQQWILHKFIHLYIAFTFYITFIHGTPEVRQFQ